MLSDSNWRENDWHVLNNKYDQSLSFFFLYQNCYLKVKCTVLFSLFTWKILYFCLNFFDNKLTQNYKVFNFYVKDLEKSIKKVFPPIFLCIRHEKYYTHYVWISILPRRKGQLFYIAYAGERNPVFNSLWFLRKKYNIVLYIRYLEDSLAHIFDCIKLQKKRLR